MKSSTRVPRVLVIPSVQANTEYFPTGASAGGVTDRVTMPRGRLELLSMSYFQIALTSLLYMGEGLPNSERVPRFSDGEGPGEEDEHEATKIQPGSDVF